MAKAQCAVERLREMVRLRRPALFALLEELGNSRLLDYATSLYKAPQAVTPLAQKVVCEYVRRLYGDRQAEVVLEQLQHSNLVNTGDHHSILGHASIFQGNILAAFGAKQSELQSYLVFAFGDIPLNNESFPRGVIFEDKRYPLFPDREKSALVYGCGKFDQSAHVKFPAPFREIFPVDDSIFNQTNLADQISLINQRLWTLCCPSLPQIVYLQVEDITREILIQHISAAGSLSKMFFERDTREKVLCTFSGVQGAWGNGSGTQLFWGRSNSGKAISLRVEADALVGEGLSIEISRQSLIDALHAKRILPGVFLSFAALLHEGFRCLGGFSQVDYLAQFARGLSQLDLVTHCEKTDGFVLGPLFMFNEQATISVWDFLANPEGCMRLAASSVERVSLLEASLTGFHRMYNAFVPEAHREHQILECDTDEIAKYLGIK